MSNREGSVSNVGEKSGLLRRWGHVKLFMLMHRGRKQKGYLGHSFEETHQQHKKSTTGSSFN